MTKSLLFEAAVAAMFFLRLFCAGAHFALSTIQ